MSEVRVFYGTSTKSTDSKVPSCSKVLQRIDKFVHKTTEAEKKFLHLQFGRTFYANNMPFNMAHNYQTKKLMIMLGGGSYKHPDRHDLGGYFHHLKKGRCKYICSTLNYASN